MKKVIKKKSGRPAGSKNKNGKKGKKEIQYPTDTQIVELFDCLISMLFERHNRNCKCK